MKKIKYLIMDVDGTLTDGKIYMGNSEEIFKAFHVKDGCGIHDIAIPHGITPIVITGRTSNIVVNRCKEIGINTIYQGIKDKYSILISAISNLSSVAYIGDDINDLPCMKAVLDSGGIVGCPKDAVTEVKLSADFIAEHNGGNGAVRDFIEWLVNPANDHFT